MHDWDVVIVGCGVGGLCSAIQLKRKGIDRFVILEKSTRLGGVWRDNTYPGAGCDVPSVLYSLSFEQNNAWTRKFAGQEEIQSYLEACAEKYGILQHVRFDCEVTDAAFDSAAGAWEIRAKNGDRHSARAFICGVGQLNRPSIPPLPGLESFGKKSFHSALWDHDYDFKGKRVAVVGNGASAIQFVPRIAAQVTHLTLFQRSPAWVVSKPDRAYGRLERWALANVPLYGRLLRYKTYWRYESNIFRIQKGSRANRKLENAARAFIAREIADTGLREKLTPDYPVGCKRILLSNEWYSTLARPNVSVVSQSIANVRPDGISTSDGQIHEFDAIIFATGFKTTSFVSPIQVTGLEGRDLNRAWSDGAEAYLGITVSGFPNFYLLYGPNTNSHNSIIFMIESQVKYIVGAISSILRRDLCYADVKPSVMTSFNVQLQERAKHFAWTAHCSNWYKTASGKLTNNWPASTLRYRWLTNRVDWQAYTVVPTKRRKPASLGDRQLAANPTPRGPLQSVEKPFRPDEAIAADPVPENQAEVLTSQAMQQ